LAAAHELPKKQTAAPADQKKTPRVATPAPATERKVATKKPAPPAPAEKKLAAPLPSEKKVGAKKPATATSKEPAARSGGTTASDPAKRQGTTGNGIVVRSGGKVTVIPRSALPVEPQPHGKPPTEKPTVQKTKAKGQTQIQLPLWGNTPKKK